MILRPKDGSPYVIKCYGREVSVFHRDDFDAGGSPIITLNTAELGALAWFWREWLGESALQPGYHMGKEIDADFAL